MYPLSSSNSKRESLELTVPARSGPVRQDSLCLAPPNLTGLSQDGYAAEAAFDACLPFGGAGLVDRGALGVDGDGDRHVTHLELVDGFHAEVGEGEDA